MSPGFSLYDGSCPGEYEGYQPPHIEGMDPWEPVSISQPKPELLAEDPSWGSIEIGNSEYLVPTVEENIVAMCQQPFLGSAADIELDIPVSIFTEDGYAVNGLRIERSIAGTRVSIDLIASVSEAPGRVTAFISKDLDGETFVVWGSSFDEKEGIVETQGEKEIFLHWVEKTLPLCFDVLKKDVEFTRFGSLYEKFVVGLSSNREEPFSSGSLGKSDAFEMEWEGAVLSALSVEFIQDETELGLTQTIQVCGTGGEPFDFKIDLHGLFYELSGSALSKILGIEGERLNSSSQQDATSLTLAMKFLNACLTKVVNQFEISVEKKQDLVLDLGDNLVKILRKFEDYKSDPLGLALDLGDFSYDDLEIHPETETVLSTYDRVVGGEDVFGEFFLSEECISSSSKEGGTIVLFSAIPKFNSVELGGELDLWLEINPDGISIEGSMLGVLTGFTKEVLDSQNPSDLSTMIGIFSLLNHKFYLINKQEQRSQESLSGFIAEAA